MMSPSTRAKYHKALAWIGFIAVLVTVTGILYGLTILFSGATAYGRDSRVATDSVIITSESTQK